MDNNDFNLMQRLDCILNDIGVRNDLRDYLIEMFLCNENFSLSFGIYNLTLSRDSFIIRSTITGDYITINKMHGLMINYSDKNKTYYLDIIESDNYMMRINTDDNGLYHIEMYERRPNKCRYSLTEGVYTYSEIKIDSGSDSDRENLINSVENSATILDFKNRFMQPIKEKFPTLCENDFFSQKSPKKVYYNKKETNA